MLIRLDPQWTKRLQGRFGRYDFQVGILEDAPHREVAMGKKDEIIRSYAGGPVRLASRKASKKTIAQISKANRERMGINYLIRPFKDYTSDVMKFSREFFKLAFGRSEKKRCENLLQAIVRNPILRKEYGSNTPITQIHKGFDRNMIDTAQLFKAIRAKCTVRGSGRV